LFSWERCLSSPKEKKGKATRIFRQKKKKKRGKDFLGKKGKSLGTFLEDVD